MLRIPRRSFSCLGDFPPRPPALLYPYGPCEGQRVDDYEEKGDRCVPKFAPEPEPWPSQDVPLPDRSAAEEEMERIRRKAVGASTPFSWSDYVKLGLALGGLGLAAYWAGRTLKREVTDWREARRAVSPAIPISLDISDESEEVAALRQQISFAPPPDAPEEALIPLSPEQLALAGPPIRGLLPPMSRTIPEASRTISASRTMPELSRTAVPMTRTRSQSRKSLASYVAGR